MSSPSSPNHSPVQIPASHRVDVEQAAAQAAAYVSTLLIEAASTGGTAEANAALAVVLRDRFFGAVHAALGRASHQFAILPNEPWLGIGHIKYKGKVVVFYLSEHHTVADLVQMMRCAPAFASLLDGLEYGKGFSLVGKSATLELAPILSSFAWKEFTFELIVRGPKLTTTFPDIPQVFPHT